MLHDSARPGSGALWLLPACVSFRVRCCQMPTAQLRDGCLSSYDRPSHVIMPRFRKVSPLTWFGLWRSFGAQDSFSGFFIYCFEVQRTWSLLTHAEFEQGGEGGCEQLRESCRRNSSPKWHTGSCFLFLLLSLLKEQVKDTAP